MQRVVVAFESEKTCHRIKDIIEQEGLAPCIVCRSGAEVKRVVAKQHVFTVICGFKLPDTSAVKTDGFLIAVSGAGATDMTVSKITPKELLERYIKIN